MTAKATTWRQQSRWECSIEATIVMADGEWPCIVTDISDGGVRVWCLEAKRLTVDAEATLCLPDRGEVRTNIRHVAGNVVGLAFAAATDLECSDTAARLPEDVARGAVSEPR